MAKFRCPTCSKLFEGQDSPTLPFCSERCQHIDLGRWLGEQHGIPVAPDDDDEQQPPEPNGEP